MTTNPYTLCPHCGETHHEDETHGCKSEIHEYEVGDYLLVAKDGDVLAVSGNSEFDDVDNPPTESGTIVHIIHVLDDGETWSGDSTNLDCLPTLQMNSLPL